jgi:hypothetical protein
MTNANFKMTKKIEMAADYGQKWFNNGASKQIVYTLFFNGTPIKQHISTKYDVNLFALVVIGDKAVNGIAITPAIECIYEVLFSINPNKKTINLLDCVCS